jgi:hypothetical protein
MSVALERYMYDKGYGPTNPLWGNYLRKHFLGQTPEADDGQRVRDLAVQHRADTLFADLLAKKTEPLPGKQQPPR